MTESKEHLRQLLLEIIRRKVALRAYELYLARGGTHGADVDDWLKAEMEVLGQSIVTPLFKGQAA